MGKRFSPVNGEDSTRNHVALRRRIFLPQRTRRGNIALDADPLLRQSPVIRMKPPLLSLALVFILPPALFAQDYQILFHRPSKAGTEKKISFTVKKSQTMTVTVDGAVQQNKNEVTAYQLEGVKKVIAVDDQGW